MTSVHDPLLTLDGLVHRNAERRPADLALVDGDQRFTWAELEALVGRLAAALRARGLAPGGAVLAVVPRTWEMPVLFLATARAGGVYVPVEVGDPARLEERLVRGGVDLVWLPARATPREVQLAERLLGDARRVIHGEGAVEALVGDEALPPSRDAEAICYLNFSSGSSGRPKPAPTTHANIVWNTRGVLAAFPFGADERFMCLFAPHSHPHEHFARALLSGATAVMLDTLRPRTVIRAMQELGVTWLFAIPSVFELILAQVQPGDRFPQLRFGESGGSVVTADLARRVEARLGCGFIPIWGCTETTGVVLHVPPWEAGRRLEMLGKPVPHYGVKVVDVDRETGVGELLVQGPGVVHGYAAEVEGAERFQDGWYRSGDLVREEEGGYLRFMGRREEMIKVAGVKVYLLDVERALGELDGVRQVVVVPASDPLRGEVPRAVIVPTSDGRLSRQDVMTWCRTHLAAAMQPRVVEFRDELPCGPSGKVNKRAVSEQRSCPVTLAVNSMLIGARPIPEVFRLARAAGEVNGQAAVVDLRSRRDPASDPDRSWVVAHHNSDFDIGDPAAVDRAIALSREHGVPIAMTSAYMGACLPGDLEYGRHVIAMAHRLAAASPDRTLILRVLGGDLYARARSLPGRWQDIRRELRDEALSRLLVWEGVTRDLSAQTGAKVVLGLEVHHGQYLSDLHDVHHCARGLRGCGWDHVGFIDDPANRFIASEGDLLGAMDFARMVRAWGGRVLAYHVKDVRYLSTWNQFHPQPMQRVGERIFVWGTNKYEWTTLGAGEVDLTQTMMAAATLAQPPHTFCMASTEFVAASGDEDEAGRIVQSYRRLVVDGRAT